MYVWGSFMCMQGSFACTDGHTTVFSLHECHVWKDVKCVCGGGGYLVFI